MMTIDTIAAVSTPRGEGGISIVRLSGPLAISIAQQIFRSPSFPSLQKIKTHTIVYGHILDPETHQIIDEVLLSVMKAPRTYTKEDIVEINCHGGTACVQKVLELTLLAGARLAEPGEFTKRAFLNGRIDLAQAEAVADIIRAKTDLTLKVAMNQLRGAMSKAVNRLRDQIIDVLAEVEARIDFPEEDLDFLDLTALYKRTQAVLTQLEELLRTAEDGKILREGLNLVIVGKPNVGKSSLLNALLQEDRAIVTEIPGTTRDTIEEYANIRGIPLKLIDTAGIRETSDIIEHAGVKRSREWLERSDLALVMLDASEPLTEDDGKLLELTKNKKAIIILNKIDLPEVLDIAQVEKLMPDISPFSPPLVGGAGGGKGRPIVKTSMLTGQGLEELKTKILNAVIHGTEISPDSAIITTVRHRDALRKARIDIEHALLSLDMAMPMELVAVDLRGALDNLGLIVGTTTTEDILDRIFSQFCIGK
jgi:tRNA modification GTPase